MGRGIDRLALLTLLAGSLYVFFIGAMGSVPLAAAAAFFSLAIIRKLAHRLPPDPWAGRRKRRKYAESELERLALSDPDKARERITKAIEAAYPGQLTGVAIAFVLRHPSGKKLDADEVVERWRALLGNEKGVVASLVEAGADAEALAARLRGPELRLIDGPRLVPLLAACPEAECTVACFRQPPRTSRIGRMARAAGRANAGKCAFTGAAMMLLFFISGAPAYLAGALGLLFIAGASIHKKRLPGNLFSE